MAYQMSKGDSHGGAGLHWMPDKEQQKYTLLFLHGLGDTAHGWAELPLSLRHRQGPFRATKYILPTAPTKRITLNGGFPMNAWADINELTVDAAEDRDGYLESADRMTQIIDAEIEAGIPPSNIFVGGFSQGAATALTTALRFNAELGGIVSLSGFLPLKGDYPAALTEGARSVPILHCHGDADQVVQYKWGQDTADFLEKEGMKIEFVTFRGMGHSACEEELVQVGDFIKDRLSSAQGGYC
eukprot:Polyplicarium_translucidae@DN725_c0_g1_i3.p1